jgi:uncharacterized protein YcnI
MPSLSGAPRRALCTAAAVTIGLLVTAAPAAAHVTVATDNPSPGGYAVLTFKVPGESDTGALTTELSVALPDLTSARTEVMPGWTARFDRDAAAGTVRSVTWTAAPGTGVSADQFALFRVSVKLPDQPSVSFPTTQTYNDGTVVRWDQAPLPGGGEPEHPAPEVQLSGSAAADDHGAAAPVATTVAAVPTVSASASPPSPAQPAADDTARWLAGGALVVAAVGVVVALLARRRA